MRLNQITIPVSNIGRSKAFYMRLGFRLLVDSEHYTRFLAPDGDTTFSLHLSEEAVSPGAVIYLECDKVDAEVARLKERGFTFEDEAEDAQVHAALTLALRGPFASVGLRSDGRGG